jgi:uncharacterized protein (DUF302 family)
MQISIKRRRRLIVWWTTASCVLALSGLLTTLSASADERHEASDALFNSVMARVERAANLEMITQIDHSRLAAGAGEEMPPSRVLIFSNKRLESELMKIDPRIGVDLPMRILAYETRPGGASKAIYNSVAYLQSRYGVTLPPDLADRYTGVMTLALEGIEPKDIARFENDKMASDGLVTVESPHGFEETLRRLRAAIDAQGDTVWFGEVDFDARASEAGVTIDPAHLLLFGGPGPGGRAMSGGPSLGLDAFCQKLLVLQDPAGSVRVMFNDLMVLAERHGVKRNLALRVINWRLAKTFKKALEP